MDLNRITIGNLQKKDTGNYGCNATNKIGYVYKDAYVNVLSLPPDIQVILMIKFIYSEKATKFCKISALLLTGTT